MNNFRTLKYRQSTDTFEKNIWFVYHDLGNFETALVKRCESKEEAVALFRSMLKDDIKLAISNLDPSKDVSDDILDKCLNDELGLIRSVEFAFSDCSYDLSQLKPLKKGVTASFNEEVRKLDRPYIAINDAQYRHMMDGKADYYLMPNGNVLTFGEATTTGSDADYALMPLNDRESDKVIKLNAK